MFAVLLIVIVVIVTWFAVRHDWGDEMRRQQEIPCEEQAPSECIGETIEQATESQFIYYVYCACMTDEGFAKGYIAARPRSERTN